MSRLRWWLARKIAPEVIVPMPAKGAAVIGFGDGCAITLTFTKARLRSRLMPYSGRIEDIGRSRTRRTFVGIAD